MRKKLKKAIENAVRFYLNHTSEKGKIDYIYYPDKDKLGKGYNWVRHAGCCYAMSQMIPFTKGKERRQLENKIRAALSYVYHRKVLVDVPGTSLPVQTVKSSNKAIKAGFIGLALTAFTTAYENISRKGFEEERRNWLTFAETSLANFIEILTQPNGKLTSKVDLKMKPKEFDSLFYPGECALGLVKLYRITGKVRYLNNAVNLMDYVTHVRDTGKNVPYDDWMVVAICEAYPYTKRNDHLKFAFKVANRICENVNEKSEVKDKSLIGGFGKKPKICCAGARNEALVALLNLKEKCPDIYKQAPYAALMDIIRGRARMISNFQMRGQINEAEAKKLPNPEKAIGGYRDTLGGKEVRSDYVQHNTSALIGLYNALRK